MAVFSGRGRVIIQEWDMSDRVPAFPGVYSAMVIQCERGKTNEPMLITTGTDLLKKCTKNETIAVGSDLALFEADAYLSKANKLWVINPEHGQLCGGIVFGQDKPFNEHGVTADIATSCLSLLHVLAEDKEKAKVIWDTMSNGDLIRISVSLNGTLPLPLFSVLSYYIIKYDESNYRFRVASTQEKAISGEYIPLTAEGNGTLTINFGSDGQVSEVQRGFKDKSTYLLDTSDGKPAGYESTFTVDMNEDAINVDKKFYDGVESGDALTIGGEADDLPKVELGDPLTVGQLVYAIKVPYANESYKIKICRLKADVANDNYINFASLGGDSFTLTFRDKIQESAITKIDGLTDAITVDVKFYNLCAKYDRVQFLKNGANDLPTVSGTALSEDDFYYVIKGTDSKIQLKRDPLETAPIINFTTDTEAATAPKLKLVDKVASTICVLDMSSDTISVDTTFWDEIETGYAVTVASDGTLPLGLSDTMTYYVIKLEEEKLIKLATSKVRADNGIAVDIRNNGELDTEMGQYHHIYDKHNSELFGYNRNCLLISNKTPCEEDIYVTLVHWPYGDSSIWTEEETSVADEIREENAFLLKVYKKYPSGDTVEVEKFIMSRHEDAKDGNGQTMYCEDVSERSFYIDVTDNKSVSPNIYPTNQTTMKKIVGSTMGNDVTTGNMISAIQTMNNRRRYSCLLLLDGGYTVPAYQKALNEVCENRQWSFGILCTPISVEQSPMYAEDIVRYRRNELAVNSSHSALYSPHVKIYDKYNDREIFVGNSGFIAAKYSETAENYELWYAVAGNTRGTLNNVLDLAVHFTEGDMDYLDQNGVNCLEFNETKGYRIWGASTLQWKASALDAIPTRMLLCVIEPALDEFLDNFVWEINDAETRDRVVNGITPYMEGIKSRRGVYDFNVICDDTNNSNEDIDNYVMNCWVFVQPTKYAKYIPCKIVITKTGSSMTMG